MKKLFELYGALWPTDDPIEIEMACIQHGGSWLEAGQPCGNGLFFHYRQLQSLLWPDDDHHRWSDLFLKEILENRITCCIGPKDSGKTRTMAKYALTDYFVFPDETLILISSTDIRGLELRVWGDLKNLFERARDVYPVAGHIIDSKHCICTDDISDENVVRDLRRGIVAIPCISSSGGFTGLKNYVGLKQKRRRLCGDEVQLMFSSYVDSIANLNSGDFKGVFVGNPLGSGDPLDKLSEPKCSWTELPEPEKTTVWENRFIGGRTINFVGTDSPNFEQPGKPKFPYLIHRESIDNIVAFYGTESLQYYSQALGVRKTGLDARRVLTRDLCNKFGAHDPAIWFGTPRTQIYAIDAAYGGDRCIGGRVEFGKDNHNNIVLCVYPPVIIPISPASDDIAEDQIAKFVQKDCQRHNIPPENVFFDSTGRGSLGTSFARIWSSAVNPLEFGGTPSNRPVCQDLFVKDDKTGARRLKKCDEHYSKFVTELWFTVRYTIESRQMRQFPNDVMDEFCQREWMMVRGDKIEIETKDDMKKRTGRSPDLADWCAIACEGARQKGFRIERLASKDNQNKSMQWMTDIRRKSNDLQKRHQLNYVTA